MPSTDTWGPFRLVGRVIPLGQPDDPEHPIFIDVPIASLVTSFEEHAYDNNVALWNDAQSVVWADIQTVTSQINIEKTSGGVAYIVHTGAPPEGYFPPNQESSAFDF